MHLALALLSGLLWGAVASAQTSVPTYRFFNGDSDTAFKVWNEARESLQDRASVRDPRRPSVRGIHGRNLELLQDYYVRYYPNATQGGLRSEATRRIANASDFRLGAYRGFMAEAVYLEKHPEWRYPSKPNTKQVDVYQPQPDGRPGIHGAQIKFHIDGNPSRYAREMLSDNKTQRFVVPDDHVDGLKARLRSLGRENEVRRVYPLGATSGEIDQRTRQAIREAKIVRVSPYVLLGAVTALELGPVAYRSLSGQQTGLETVAELAESAPPVATAIVVDQALKQRWLGSGNLRGSVKGIAIVGAAYLLVDSGILVQAYGGGQQAVRSPHFWIDRGTAVASLAICMKVAAAGAATGGIAGVGAGVVCSVAVDYVFSEAGRRIAERLEWNDEQEKRIGSFTDVQRELYKELKCLRSFPVSIESSGAPECGLPFLKKVSHQD